MAALAAAPAPAVAEGSSRGLLTAAEQAQWPGVARLNLTGQGHCTATLIGPDLALTAAHCLDPRGVATLLAADRMHVLAGWRMGAAAAHFRGTAAAAAPGWRPGALATDAALIRLAPVSGAPEDATPLRIAPPPAPGAPLITLSYGRDRPEALSRQTGCRLVARQGDLLVTDCEGTPGVSGAPLLAETPDGPALIGVVVAVAEARPPARRGPILAVAASALMPGLRAALAAAEAGR